MNRKLSSMWRVGLALVLALTLGLVMAVPAYADDISTSGSASVNPSYAGATATLTVSFTSGTTEITGIAAPVNANTVTFDLPDASVIGQVPEGGATVTLTGGISAWTSPPSVATDTNVVTIEAPANEGLLASTSFGIEVSSITNPTIIGSYDVTVTTEQGNGVLTEVDTGTTSFTVDPNVLDHFDVATSPPSPVVGETVTVTVTAEDQFNNTLTTYSENLFLSQTGADTPTLIVWSGADVTDYANGTGRFTGTWTDSVCTVDVSYTIASDPVTLKVTGDSTTKLGSSAPVTWVAVEISAIVGTTYQNGNDTILITFGTEVQPASEGPWSATVFASVKCDIVELSLVGASFTPLSGLTDTLTITLDETNAYLVNGVGVKVFVTPAFEAIKGTGGNFVPNTEVESATGVSGDIVDPTVALTYNPDRDVKDADTLTITATFSEAMPDTPQIAINTTNVDLSATDMTGSGATWTYAYDVPAGSDGTATVTITGTDLAGNPVGAHSTATFIIDNIVPTIAVSAVVGLTSGTADTITITFTEDGGVAATDGDFEDGNEVAGITLKKADETDVIVNLTGATFEKADPELDFTTTLTITLAETGNVPDYLINTYTVTFDPSDTNTIEDGAVNLLAVTAIDGTTDVTGDATPPTMSTVVGTIQAGDDTVTITFDEKVRPADGTWSADEFTMESPVDAPLNINNASFAIDASNTVLTITLNQATDGAFLVAGDAVVVTPEDDAVLDLAGIAMTAPKTGFVIGDPFITSIVGTTILGAGDTIVITFSEAVTLTETTPEWSLDEFDNIQSPDGTGLTLTNAVFSIDGTNTVLTITLDEANDGKYLVNGDTVSATPADGKIEDADSNSVANTKVVGAAVVSGETTLPTIVSIAGTIVLGTAAGQEDIIRIDFSEAVVHVVADWDDEFAITATGAGVDLTDAIFAPLSGITTTLTITLLATNELPEGETLTVTPFVDKVVDLAGNKMSDEVDSTAPVQAPSAAFVINLEADWNLISLPLVPTDADIEAVLAGLVNANTVIQVQAYNTDGTWSRWASTGPFAVNPTLTEMNDGLGFWIEMSTGDKLVASGSDLPAPPLSPPSYSVYEGWNLIGFKSLPESTVLAYLGALVDATREAMYGYDALGVIYIPITVGGDPLYPGQGYWLAVNADGTIYP